MGRILVTVDSSQRSEIMAEAKKKEKVGKYEMGVVLGEGAFSKVRLGVDTVTKAEVAVKIVNQSLIQNMKDMERVIREIHVLKNIKHPNIIRLYEAIDKGTHVYLVMEYAEGGELYEYIAKHGPLPTSEAKKVFHQILSGVDYCHRQLISHRDLKPENVLLDKNLNAKVIDFGLSNDMQPGVLLKTTCGSPCYAAPEMINGKKYDGAAIDVWSCGVILYCICCGKLPFSEDSQAELFRKISGGVYSIPESVSADAADLIRQFLTVQPEKRITIAQAWQHPWLASFNSTASLTSDEDPARPLAVSLEVAAGDMSLDDGADGPLKEDVLFELLPHHALPASLLAGDRDEHGSLHMRMEFADTQPVPSPVLKRGAAAAAPKEKHEQKVVTAKVFLPRKKETSVTATPRAEPTSSLLKSTGPATRTPIGSSAASATSRTTGLSASKTTTSALSASKTSSSSSSAAAASIKKDPSSSPSAASASSDRKPGLPTAAKAASAAAAKTKAETETNEDLYSDPKLANSMLCAITKKDPRVILREIQKLFSDHKVLLRAASTTTIKGEKSRVRFELVTSQLVSVNGTSIAGDPLFVVTATRLAGEMAAFREVCRKLLSKL